MRVSKGVRDCGSRRRRGSATLEFALLLPVLMTLGLLCVDFGRFAHTYIAVTNAARTAAGHGAANPFTTATRPTWEAQVRQAAIDELASQDPLVNRWFDPQYLVMPAPETFDEGNGFWRVRVDVGYPFSTLINWPFLPGYNEPIILRRVVSMRGSR